MLTREEMATGRLTRNAQWAEDAFTVLEHWWDSETGMLSSLRQRAKHPAYQAILAMRENAVAPALRRVAREIHHWASLLHDIVGEDAPGFTWETPDEEVQRLWREWAERNGFAEAVDLIGGEVCRPHSGDVHNCPSCGDPLRYHIEGWDEAKARAIAAGEHTCECGFTYYKTTDSCPKCERRRSV